MGNDAVESVVAGVVQVNAVGKIVGLLVVDEVWVPVLISDEADLLPEFFLREKTFEGIAVCLSAVHLAAVDEY